jgi:hypothetical protein
MGGPGVYAEDIADLVLELMAAGSTLKAAAKAVDIPWQTVWCWRTRYPDFATKYQRAGIERAHATVPHRGLRRVLEGSCGEGTPPRL